MRKRTFAREAAMKILYANDITGETMEETCRKFWENRKSIDQTAKEFSDLLVFGFDAHRREVDKIITGYAANWTMRRMATIDRNILRLAAFELIFVEETPPKVAINEAIEMAKKYGDKDSGKFVNGILDKVNKTELRKWL